MGKSLANIGIRALGEGNEYARQEGSRVSGSVHHQFSRLVLGSNRKSPTESSSRMTKGHSNSTRGFGGSTAKGNWMKQSGKHGSKYRVNPRMMAARYSIQKAKGFHRNGVRFGLKKGAADSIVGFAKEKRLRCYQCREKGHKAVNCPSKLIVPSTNDDSMHREYLVKGTEYGNWNKIWILHHGYKKHVTGDKSMFIRFKDCFNVMTKTNAHDMLFTHGIGEIEIFINGNFRVIPSVSYVPNLAKNILSANQLASQGFDFTLEGDVCYIKDMFESNGDYGVDDILKNDHQNPFFENKNEQACFEGHVDNMVMQDERGDELNKITKEIFIKFMDDLKDFNYVIEYKESLKRKFPKLVKWFFDIHIKQPNNKVYPPTLPNGNEIDLLDLYMYVYQEGGYRMASKNDKWGEIAQKLGMQVDVGPNLKTIYTSYLDLLAWNYETVKRMEETCKEPTPSLASDVKMMDMKEDGYTVQVQDEDNKDDDFEDDLEDFVLIEDLNPSED